MELHIEQCQINKCAIPLSMTLLPSLFVSHISYFDNAITTQSVFTVYIYTINSKRNVIAQMLLLSRNLHTVDHGFGTSNYQFISSAEHSARVTKWYLPFAWHRPNIISEKESTSGMVTIIARMGNFQESFQGVFSLVNGGIIVGLRVTYS